MTRLFCFLLLAGGAFFVEALPGPRIRDSKKVSNHLTRGKAENKGNESSAFPQVGKLWKNNFRNVNEIVDHLPLLLRLLRIRTTRDVVKMIRNFKSVMISLEPSQRLQITIGAELMIAILKDAKVRKFVDSSIEDLPKLSPVVHDIRRYFEGPEGKPFFDVIDKILPPFVLLSRTFNQALVLIVEEATKRHQTVVVGNLKPSSNSVPEDLKGRILPGLIVEEKQVGTKVIGKEIKLQAIPENQKNDNYYGNYSVTH